ncbi:MAG TPA: DUF72 domain-containing protein [Longimicrobium sp.]|jgi:uncharacterized protein YecE (DUF72 family)
MTMDGAEGPAVRVGCAGWTVPRDHAARFPGEGSHLERYARVFGAAEINSSFHRPHRRSTYERWAASTPLDFRFSVKLPKEITHKRKLVGAAEPLERFLAEAGGLGEKLGPLLVQLPPSLAFDPTTAPGFFALLRGRCGGDVVLEPRHPSWFGAEPEALLAAQRVARVAADPAPVPEAAAPGGWAGLAYFRLHGSPRTYYSAYTPDFLDALAARLRPLSRAGPAWCIFDNTAAGAAAGDALQLLRRLA